MRIGTEGFLTEVYLTVRNEHLNTPTEYEAIDVSISDDGSDRRRVSGYAENLVEHGVQVGTRVE